MIEFYSPFSRKYLILTQTPQTYAEHASLTRVYRPDGSEGEATRKFCVSLRSLRENQIFARKWIVKFNHSCRNISDIL